MKTAPLLNEKHGTFLDDERVAWATSHLPLAGWFLLWAFIVAAAMAG